MRTFRGFSALAALAALALVAASAVGLAAPAYAYTLPVPTELSLSGNLNPVLTGEQYSVVDVQVRLVCDTGAGCDPALWQPALDFGEAGVSAPVVRWPDNYAQYGGGLQGQPLFTRISGDAADGVYRASVVFSAAANGAFVVNTIAFVGRDERVFLDGVSGLTKAQRTVTTKGSDPAIVRADRQPGAVLYGKSGPMKERFLVQTRDSGRNLAGRTVWLCRDACITGGTRSPVEPFTTDASGYTPYVTGSYPVYWGFAGYMRTLTIHGVDEVFRWGTASYFPPILTRPSATSITLGGPSTTKRGSLITLRGVVTGNGNPARPDTVIVQRWVSGKWSTLGRSTMLATGRWSYATVPRSSGVYQYRVVKPTNACSNNVCLSPNATSGTLRVTVR